jgi:hypothetical protein
MHGGWIKHFSLTLELLWFTEHCCGYLSLNIQNNMHRVSELEVTKDCFYSSLSPCAHAPVQTSLLPFASVLSKSAVSNIYFSCPQELTDLPVTLSGFPIALNL